MLLHVHCMNTGVTSYYIAHRVIDYEDYIIHADDVPRTIQSAEALFFGLYPHATR